MRRGGSARSASCPNDSGEIRARERDVLALESFLPYQVAILSRRLSKEIEGIYRREHGLAQKDWKVVQILANHGPLLPGSIGTLGTLDKATIRRAITCLLDRGLAVTRPCTGDGRTFEVALSAAGLTVYGKIVPKARRRQEEILAVLSLAQ
jgi:DNA-binding MarR family transcriptional regulator